MSFQVGMPAIDQYGTHGFVSAVTAVDGSSFTIGAGGLEANRQQVEICWASDRISELPDSIARTFTDRASRQGLPMVEGVAEKRAAVEAIQTERREEASRAASQAAERLKAFRFEATEKVPSWAKAVLVAELIEDQSDSMSDYHGSTTRRTVILGFSPHTRDLFPEMRKAAASFPETAELATMPEGAEHREKYSMGGGYYLKAGYRHSSGWRVEKRRLDRGAESVPFGEWHLEAAPATHATASEAPSGLRIEEHTHTKKGFQMHICILPDRVEPEEFERLTRRARELGGWYSRQWGRTPGGFAFKDRAAAEGFTGTIAIASPSEEGDPNSNAPAKPSPIAARLREMADRLQADIDAKFAERRTNTPKQQREAGEARNAGWHLTRAQQAMRALGAAHDAGTVPAVLAKVTTKAAILELSRSRIDRSRCGYYDAGVDTNEPASDSADARAFWEMIAGKSDQARADEELRNKVEALRFAKIPGYFPTPAAIVAEMIAAAGLPDGGFTVLEPSAGSGAIVAGLRAHAPGAIVSAFEHWPSLREVLTLKGVDVIGSDFLEAEPSPRFDRVLMNPPFEKGQDIEHVRHAFGFLKAGGRLVAIMSPGPFFRQDRKAVEFRTWFEWLGGEKHDLPAGAFKESGTGVASVMITLEA